MIKLYGEELERRENGDRIERIYKDANGFFLRQFKYKDDSMNPGYNDGWTTTYSSGAVLSVHGECKSNYYYLRRLGYSIEEALTGRVN